MISRRTHFYGMTLLEMLLALGLFAFISVFISQTLKQSYRHARKARQDIQFKNSLSHVLSLIRKDLLSTGYLLDINANFNAHFPIEETSDSEEAPAEREAGEKTPSKEEERFPVFLNPLFVFEGKSREMSFVSYSFSQRALDPSSSQWARIHYFVQDCDLVEEGVSGKCLFRSVRHKWSSIEEVEPEEQLILFRGLDFLEFSYSGKKKLLESEWESEWREREGQSHPEIFPTLLKIEMKKGNRETSFLFPVSHNLLRGWNPKSKAYPGFPQWKAPKTKKKEPPR